MSPWPFFWKTFLVSLFPEALQLRKERSVLGTAAILKGQACLPSQEEHALRPQPPAGATVLCALPQHLCG